MKTKKESKGSARKTISLKTEKIVNAYRILTTPNTPDRKGLVVTSLDPQDMYRVIRAAHALRPVATAVNAFIDDAKARLRPEGWSEIEEKIDRFDSLEPEEKTRVNKIWKSYEDQMSECVASELEKEQEVDAYEHIDEKAFVTFVKANDHLLDVPSIMLLEEIIA